MTAQAPEPPIDEATSHLPLGAWHDPAVFVVTGFGSGFLRPAPGTWGSLIALALWWWLLADLAWPEQLAAIALTIAIGTWLTHRVGQRYGVHDDPRIVIDEFAGLWLALLAVPATWITAVVGFLLFRALDIAKPWPIGWADRRVPGAAGVMLDDLIAGAMALAVLHLGLWLAA
jgi:phosphatidylglycerophosphatase A